ncbi:MAG: hypothetical protein M3371_07185 [Acidobacteriota bacterium]|nr:hypothetical protein [Acidobacteriota bacterium]
MSQQHDNTIFKRGDSRRPAEAPALACPACGATARRSGAHFCSTCGRGLDHESYLPADSLLSSYHRQRLSGAPSRFGDQLPPREARIHSPSSRMAFAHSQHGAMLATAIAFVTYSLVPYLGILFSPGAILTSGLALARTRRAAHKTDGGSRRAAYSLVLALVIFAAQLLLWWVLYKVPEWTRP